jgi:hypothetical protein
MRSLLRADWLRIRRRWDVWIIVLGIPVLTLLAYVAGASSSGNASVQFSGDVPADIKAQALAAEAAMRAFQALPYQFPRSIVTMAQGATLWLVVGAAFLAASMLGSEFSWGTIRNVALFRPDRLRYLAARLLWLASLVLMIFVAVVALGAIAPMLVRVDPGNPSALTPDLVNSGMVPPGPTGAVSLGGALLVAMSLFCVALAGMALAGLAALKFRSAASGLLVAGIYAIVEGIGASLLMSRATGDLRYVPQMGLTIRLAALLGDAQTAAGLTSGEGGQSSAPGWVSLPPFVGVAILSVWLVGLFGLWFVVLRRADIDE